jgi:putative hydrolases of HD superfamily
MDRERLLRQLDFILEIDKEKRITRQTSITGHIRKENDAEHAWHMALMSFILKEYSNEDIDITRVIVMCLVHDIVEIDAGDTYAYDEEGKKTQAEREEKAKKRIFGLLPDDQAELFMGLFEEFEADVTPEAHFAHAMDNFQPLLLNNSNGGADWREHDVTYEKVMGRQGRTAEGSRDLFSVTKEIMDENVKKGSLKK